MMAQPGPQRICVICGEDCSQRPRIKDPKGRYFCKNCYEEAKRRRPGAAPPRAPRPPPEHRPEPSPQRRPDEGFDVMAEILETISACPGCGQALGSGAIVCTNCGYNVRTGKPAEADTAEPMPGASGSRLLDARVSGRLKGLEAARRLVRAEYVKPLVLLGVGAAVTMVAMMGAGAATKVPIGVVAVILYPLGLGIRAVIGSAVVWLAAKTWLGDLGPLHLILLRIAGIYAVIDALGVITLLVSVGGENPGFACFGLLAIVGCFYGLTAWLFELSFLQIVGLNIFAFVADFLVLLGVRALASVFG